MGVQKVAQKVSGGSRALFLELVLDLVIFALCATICLQVFAQARLESQRSEALSQLGIEAQQVAETFKSGVFDSAALAQRSDASSREGDTLLWYYDRDCLPVTRDEAYFTLRCVIDASQPVRQARISLAEDSVELFAWEVSRYLSNADAQAAGAPAAGALEGTAGAAGAADAPAADVSDADAPAANTPAGTVGAQATTQAVVKGGGS
jgi:Tfp pilus assembly protein PilE